MTDADVRRAGEPDREILRDRAAHAGPIDENTLVYRIGLHTVRPKTELGRLSGRQPDHATLSWSDSDGNLRARPSTERPLPAKAA